MAIIGYARVSTGKRTLNPQLVELHEAGCGIIHEGRGTVRRGTPDRWRECDILGSRQFLDHDPRG